MICPPCARRVRSLRASRAAGWSYDPLACALVWDDERVELCPPCSRVYDSVCAVRTQLLVGERPGVPHLAVYEQFRALFPKWPGFRRREATAAQQAAATRPLGGRAQEEIRDED